MDNRKEFEELILTYERITLQEIKDAWDTFYNYGGNTLFTLTGFSSTNSCSLCQPIDTNCTVCMWYKAYDCRCTGDASNPNANIVSKSYWRISNADTPMKTLYAIRSRAKIMRNLLKHYDEQQKRI